MNLVRFFHPTNGSRFGVRIDNMVHDVTDEFSSITEWLIYSCGRVEEAIVELQQAANDTLLRFPIEYFENTPDYAAAHWLTPIDVQEVWAAGVTYKRSREARQEESQDGGDVYARVYEAARPELFFKANGEKVVGHLDQVGIRSDATWSVPEPELGLVLNPAMEVVGFTVGNDMSSRDIEGENPLYLPQAKVYTASCAIGNSILLQPSEVWPTTTIHITITRDHQLIFEDQVHTDRIHRSIEELVGYLSRSNEFPYGVVLLTGTGVVPPSDFTLQEGDIISISIDYISTLTNTVMVV